MKKLLALLLIVGLWGGGFQTVNAIDSDVGFEKGDVFFSVDQEDIVVNQPIRIYARVHNLGDEDVLAHVVFKSGSQIIGQTQPISLVAHGLPDEVFVEWIVPTGAFNVMAEVVAIEPTDGNLSNNQSITKLIEPLTDFDGDGIADRDDNDDDNDQLSDSLEKVAGTNPLNRDTDGDGTDDYRDAYPLDNTKISKEVPESVPTPEPMPAPAPAKPDVVVQPVEKKVSAPTLYEVTDDKAEEVEDAEDDSAKAFATVDYEREVVNGRGLILNGTFIDEVTVTPENHGWGKYYFTFTTNVDNFDVSLLDFTWDYGDGDSSKVNENHAFRMPGVYYVKITVDGPFGNTITDVVTVEVPFFSFGNAWLWLLVGIALLIVFFIVLGWRQQIKKGLKKKKKYKLNETDD